jgi:hypothetical protein
MKFTQIGLASLTFLTTAVCCAAVIHQFTGDPNRLYAEFRSEKFEILSTYKDSTNLVIFGSSHTHNGFDPRAFDKALGLPAIRSLNMAIQGGSQVEQRSTALAYLRATRLKPEQPCYVLLELNAGVNFQNLHLTHPRAINAYSTDSIALVFSFADKELGATRRAGRIGYAVTAGAMHYGNVGMLSSRLFRPALNETELQEQLNGDRRGLTTPPLNDKETAEVEQYLMHSRAKAPPLSALPSAGHARLIQDLENTPKTCLAKYFYVVSPKVTDLEGKDVYPEKISVGGLAIPILNMADPEKYPGLYQSGMWHDMSHLSERGAGMFSSMLAEAIRPYLTAH